MPSWLGRVLGPRLAALIAASHLQEFGQQLRHEHTLLYSIINAVTDPILLTDADGRIMIANARAEALLATGEDQSEGRRRAVALNNMLFSAALSRHALEGAGAPRSEVPLVDPVDGSDLLFELLSTVDQRRPRGHRRRVDAAQRHRPAAGHRRDRGELPAPAPDGVRSPRRARPAGPGHRLGGRSHHRDRSRRQHRDDERPGRAALHRARSAVARRPSASCRPTTPTSRPSSPTCSSRPTPAAAAAASACRPPDRHRAAHGGDLRQDRVRARRGHRGGHHPARPHRGAGARAPLRGAEEGLGRAGAQGAGGDLRAGAPERAAAALSTSSSSRPPR